MKLYGIVKLDLRGEYDFQEMMNKYTSARTPEEERVATDSASLSLTRL